MATRLFVWTAVLISTAFAWVGAQTKPALTARELFYAAGKKPAANPGQRATSPPAPSAAPKSAPKSAPQTSAATPPARPPVSQPAGSGTPAMTAVSYSPLGMRYSILKRAAPGKYDEADVDTVFRSGDGLRLTIESNDDAYLYIVNKGSSGSWSVLFPSSQIDSGNNRVQAHRRYEVPAGGQFTFENPPGEERLFIVLTREPEIDLEKLIYSLNRPGAPGGAEPPKVLTVQAISDDLIGRLRTSIAARDLVFEKVDDQSSERKEKAAYVVNATGATGGRVVKDLSLKHQ